MDLTPDRTIKKATFSVDVLKVSNVTGRAGAQPASSAAVLGPGASAPATPTYFFYVTMEENLREICRANR